MRYLGTGQRYPPTTGWFSHFGGRPAGSYPWLKTVSTECGGAPTRGEDEGVATGREERYPVPVV